MASENESPLSNRALQSDEGQVIFDSVPAMIWFKDGNNRIIRVNRTAAASVDVTPESLEGAEVADYFPDEAASYLVDDQEVMRTGVPKRNILELVQMASGEKRWVQTDKLPYRDANGNIIGVIVFSLDVHERVIAERRNLELQRELERSNRDLEEFASIISHDLREPLRMVASYLNLLDRQDGNVISPRSREFLRYARDGASRMRDMLDGILAYSRVARIKAADEVVDTAKLVGIAMDNLKIALVECGASVEIAELPRVRGNSVQLTQLFQNLIANALKFRGERTPVCRIFAEVTGPEARFTIADNGIGLPEESQGRVFQVFQRFHGRAYPGTGTGLAICKRIVERHGGRIWVDSVPEQGAAFHFTLLRG